MDSQILENGFSHFKPFSSAYHDEETDHHPLWEIENNR